MILKATILRCTGEDDYDPGNDLMTSRKEKERSEGSYLTWRDQYSIPPTSAKEVFAAVLADDMGNVFVAGDSVRMAGVGRYVDEVIGDVSRAFHYIHTPFHRLLAPPRNLEELKEKCELMNWHITGSPSRDVEIVTDSWGYHPEWDGQKLVRMHLPTDFEPAKLADYWRFAQKPDLTKRYRRDSRD